MKLMHIQTRAAKNSLYRVINELDRKMYPLGLKEEVKYVNELNDALNRKYSKVEIANMVRRIMSYVILTNSPVLESAVSLALKYNKAITGTDMLIVVRYIIANNQYISKLKRSVIYNVPEKVSNNHLLSSQICYGEVYNK